MHINITEIFGTKYFYITFAKDMDYFVEAIKSAKSGVKKHAESKGMESVLDAILRNEQVTLDIAGAVFTSDVVNKLINFQVEGIQVIDSKIHLRNSILAENARRLNVNFSSMEALPEFTYDTDLVSYIRSLDGNITYNILNWYRMPVNVQYSLLALITMCRPDVRVYIREITSFFSFVAALIPSDDIVKYTKFYAYDADDSLIELDFSDGTAWVPNGGQVSVEQAVRYVTLIPKVFGTEPTVNNPTFQTLLVTATERLNAYKKSRPKTLAEVCGVEVDNYVT